MIATTPEALYALRIKDKNSDLGGHLSTLKDFASMCNHVTEFGIREGSSTLALALGLNNPNKKLISYDIVRHIVHDNPIFKLLPCQWEFRKIDIISPGWEIDITDFLFVDDLHTYKQVKTELAQHGHKVTKYLGFHDTTSQGIKSLDRPSQEGILRAIKEYTNNQWKLVYEATFNNGLQIYERI